MDTTSQPLMPLGNSRVMVPIEGGVRTLHQTRRVLEIVADPNFDFACMNPCERSPEDPKGGYRAAFHFVYYTKDGKLHVNRITPTGLVTRKAVA